VAAAAERNDVSRALIYLWRKQARAGEIPGVSVSAKAVAKFTPVRLVQTAPVDPKLASPRSRERRRPAVIEITLANGRVVKVEETVDPSLLARIVAALDGGAA
jgi:transposase